MSTGSNAGCKPDWIELLRKGTDPYEQISIYRLWPLLCDVVETAQDHCCNYKAGHAVHPCETCAALAALRAEVERDG